MSSTVIDQRVAELRFDNQHFEKNVQTSMSTLEKLKQKLNLSGASKGLEEVNAAAGKVNMSGLGNSVETVRTKFSALEVMGVTALANITNSAVNASKRIVKSFTVDPISAGFNEYELKMGSVQTIMASTGESLETVNKHLDELNKYSDQTIYSFSDMTQNIGKFTNAGVKLDDAVLAIKGISNEAALSGANANEASRAMYNFSQALSAGHVKLIDWKSIENANMATVGFKEQLIESAVAAGTLTKSADGMYKTVKGKTISATKNFNDSLQDQWMTSEVLISTLSKYADETTDIGKKATQAATEVKTFSMMMDTLKESAQSGWARTWEIIFGDFNEGKALWTSLTEFFGGIIDKMNDFRNKLLESALGKSFKGLAEKIKTVTDPIKNTTDSIKGVVDTVKDYDKVVNEIIAGKWGNAPTRWQDLTKAGYDWAHAQNLVNEKLGDSTRHATKYKEATDGTTKANEKAKESTSSLTKEEAKQIEALLKLSDAELKAKGYTDEQIKALRELERVTDQLGLSVSDFLKNIDKIDGRWLLLNSFKNIGQGIVAVFKAMKDAWVEIFPPMTSDQLFNIIAAFHKFSTNLVVSKDTAENLKRTLKGVFAALDIILTIVGGPIKIAFKLLTQLLGAFDLNILDVTAVIGDAIVKFRDWIDSTLDFTKVFKFIAPYVTKGAAAVREWFVSLKESEALKKLTASLKKAGSAIKEWISGLKDSKDIPKDIISGFVNGLKDGAPKVWEAMIELGRNILTKIKEVLGIHSPSTEFFEIGKNVIDGFINGVKDGFSKVIDFFKNFGTGIAEFVGNIPWGKIFATGLSVGMLMLLKKFTDILGNLTAPLGGLGDLFSGAGEVLEKSAKGVGKILKQTAKVVKSFSKVMNSVAFSIKAKALKNIAIAIAILAASIIALSFIEPAKLWNAVGVVATLAVILVALGFAAEKMSKATVSITKNGIEKSGFTSALLSIGVALLLLAATVKLVGSMNPDQAKHGFLGLAGLVVAMGLVFAAYGTLVKGKSAQNIDKAGGMMFKMSIALLLMVTVAKKIAGMTWGDMGKAAVGILGFVGIVALLMLISTIAGKNVDKVGITISKIAGALLMMFIVAKLIAGMSWDEMGKAATGILGLVGVIALLTLITRLAGGKLLGDIGDTLIKMAGAMFLLVIVAKLINSMSWGEMGKALVGLSGLAGVVALLVLITKLAGKEAPKIAGTLLALSLAIGILAAVAIVLSLIDLAGLAKGVIAVGILSALMSLMIYAARGVQDCKGTIMGMAVAIGVMAASIAILSFIDPSKLVGPTTAMTILMGMFAIIVKAGSNIQKATGTLIVMTVAIAVLTGALYLIAQLPVAQALGASLALSVLMVAMSGCLLILSSIGKFTKDALFGVLALTAMVIPMLAFVGVLAVMQGVQNATTNALLLTGLMTAMTLLLIPLSIIGALVGLSGGIILLGIVALTAMAIPMVAFVGVLALMQNIQGATTNVNLLITLMSALTNMLVKISLVAPLAVIGVGAMYALTGLIVGVGALAIAVGALVQKFPALQTFIDSGIPLLIKMAGGLGEMIGAFVGGIAEQLVSTLPIIGTSLSQFMINAMPFITGASAIKPEMMSGVKALAQAVLILTGAGILEGLTKIFGGESSLSSFGAQLGGLGTDLKTFVTNLGTFSEDQVTTVNCAGKAIKALATAASQIPNEGGWAAKILGENSLSAFGAQLGSLGTNLNTFVTNLGTFSEEQVTTVDCAGKAIKALATAASEIPNEGGWAAKILGDNSLATFGSKLPQFGTDLAGFVTNLGTFSDGQVTTVDCAGKAIKTLAAAANSIPNEGGLWSKIVGDNSLATFGSKLPGLAKDIAGFVSGLGTFGEGQIATVNAACDAIRSIANLGKIDLSDTSSGMKKLGGKMEDFAKKIASFVEKMNEVGGSNITGAIDKTKELIDLAKTAAGTNVDSLKTFGTSLKKVASEGVKGFVKEFTGESPKSKVTNAAKDLLKAFTKGLDSNKKSVQDKFEDVAKAGAKKLSSQSIKDSAKSAGKELVNGFADGITAQTWKAEAKARAMANAAEKAAKEALDINSPSKVFRALGYSVPEGFAMGIDKLSGMAVGSSESMASTAIRSVKDSISRIADYVNADIDSQPTIRPVLDLSDVKSGAGLIGSMLSSNPTVGVRANVSAINTMMNNRQNGNNDDVISAIRDLGRTIGNNTGNTYSINGITYDDGSNVANAIQALTRAAIMERRV